MNYKIVPLILLLTTSICAKDYSGYAGNYLHNGIDARSIAMGNALTAGSNLSFPAYYNPALVASVSEKIILFTHQFLTLGRRQSAISITTPLPPIGGLSVGWIGAGVNAIDGRNLAGAKTDDLSAAENAFLISFGIAPNKKLQIGGNVKILQNQLPNIDGNIVGNGVGFDFGALYNYNNKLKFAVVLKDINSAYQWSNQSAGDLGRIYKDKFPLQVRAGANYTITTLILAVDIGAYFIDRKYLDYEHRIGAEYVYDQNYYFRIGLQDKMIAFGIGLKRQQLNKFTALIDYAIVVEPVAGLKQIISYAINF